MSIVKISEMTQAVELNAVDAMPVVNNGITKKTLLGGLADWVLKTYAGFLPAGTGSVATTVEKKLQESISPQDKGALVNGVISNTAAIQTAVTAQAGKTLYFPDGDYVNASTPTGIDDVHCVGSPRVNFIGQPIPLFSGVYSGNKEIAVVAGVIRYYDATITPLGRNYVNGETVSIVKGVGVGGTATITTSGVASGVNTVTLATGGSGYTSGSGMLTSSSGYGCQVTITAVAGAVTAITKKSAWYFLKDGQEHHDPILLGPITSSGSASLIMEANFGDLGLNTAEWTPAGFVVGPDETLADSGVSFGASVSSTSVTIAGTYNCAASGYVSYNGSAWVFSGIGYDTPTFSGGVLTLTRPNNSTKAAYNFLSNVVAMMRRQTAADWGANIVNIALYSTTSTTVSFVFTDASGATIATPDTRMKFWMSDSAIRNPAFNFGADPGGGTNIWMVGVFTRREDNY
jgi:hypothetical protein